MFLVTLVMTVCSVTSPDKCEKVSVDWEYSFQECLLYGQQHFANEYLPSHPNRVLRKYRCTIEPIGGSNNV